MMRSVLVTGASKGIGQAIACRLAADGFSIVVHYHSDKTGAEYTLQQIVAAGGQGRLIQFDISNRTQCREQLEQDIEVHGAYYGVVNNAGITRDGAFPALSEEDWDGVIHTNLDSFYNVLHPCVMPMIGLRKGGRIIALSSVSGVMGNRGQVNYSAAKAGVIGACKALAIELAKRKITVNCIAPGLIDTGMIDMEPAALIEAMRAIPLKRMGSAEEVAGQLFDVRYCRLRNAAGHFH
jgi:3-oxoacyl-[acyl-carrier protein] reductase